MSADMMFSQKPITHNVSAFGNNCGLFAVILAIKLIIKKTPSLRTKARLPKFIDEIHTLNLQKETKETMEVSEKLRKEICKAMLCDVDFKAKRYVNFLNCCRAFVEGENFEIDMSAFVKANKEYIENLKLNKDIIKKLIGGAYVKNEKEFKEFLIKGIAEKKIVNELTEKLSKIVTQPNETIQDSCKKLVESYFQNGNNPLLEYRTARLLFNIAWKAVTVDTGIKRLIVKDHVDSFFSEKKLMLLKGSNIEAKCLQIALVEKTGLYDQGGIKTSNREEVVSLAIACLIESDLCKQWETIYKKYCEHIQNSTEMLSADELGCLANYYNIQLKIQFPDRQYKTYDVRIQELMHINLCNPTRIHWMVVAEEDSQTTGIGNNEQVMEKIIKLFSGIQNFEFRENLLGSISNKEAYDRVGEDCSYIVGVFSAIKDFPMHLKKLGKSFLFKH